MDDRVYLSLIYDFYGELLTEKQKYIFESRYGEDMSFQEIGENCGITKQAVSDTLRRTEKQLKKYEEKLGLAEKYVSRKEKIGLALKALESGNTEAVKEILESLSD
ncbi:MAG: YlxM family DNA-binding protein [Clostridiales bacterium]|nr:YlxM family DNA-binding protein [Clostridiales bacterium]